MFNALIIAILFSFTGERIGACTDQQQSAGCYNVLEKIGGVWKARCYCPPQDLTD